MVSAPCRALHDSPCSVLLFVILWVSPGDSHAGRDLLTTLAAFSALYGCFIKTEPAAGREICWKSTPAEKVGTENSRMQGRNSFIVGARLVGKKKREK